MEIQGFDMGEFREGKKKMHHLVFLTWSVPLLAIAKSVLLEETESEDIVAEAFYQLFHSRQRMNSLAEIRNFLGKIVEDKCKKNLTKRNIGKSSVENEAVAKGLIDLQNAVQLFLSASI